MSKNLVVKISKRVNNGVESWEGTITVPGLMPTKIAKSKGGESKFSSRSTLTSTAQRLATKYGFGELEFEGAGSTKEEKPKAVSRKPRAKKVETQSTEAQSI